MALTTEPHLPTSNRLLVRMLRGRHDRSRPAGHLLQGLLRQNPPGHHHHEDAARVPERSDDIESVRLRCGATSPTGKWAKMFRKENLGKIKSV